MTPFQKLKAFFDQRDPGERGLDKAGDYDVVDQGGDPKHFRLLLGGKTVGHLRYGNGQWLFEYDEGYRQRVHAGELGTVVGFPNLDERYTSPSLWPFFKIRIPGAYIKRELGREHISEAELLERFGRKTISNPYQLEPA